MSRKRKDKPPVADAVPSEILAEGSGPNEVVDANPQSLVAAAQDLVDKRKDRKSKGKQRGGAAPEVEASDANADAETGDVESADADAIEAAALEAAADAVEAAEAAEGDVVAAESEDLAAAPVSAAEEPSPRTRKKRGKRGAVGTESDVSAPETVASDAAELAAGDIALAELDAEAAHADDSPAAEAEPDEAAFDAAADNVAPESLDEQAAEIVATAEGEAIASVEDAVMRAEAEAELGAAEPDIAAEGDVELELGATLPTTAASMDAPQLKNLVEALVFAADKPVTLQRLRQLTRVSDVKRLEDALESIAADFQDRGIALQIVSGGYQFRTNTSYSVWVQQLIAGRPVRLSRAQLETLAIVAYRQPITRPEIDDIRGVDSSATLRLLLDRSLIRSLGKKEDVGRPMLYGTTKEFLDFFSLNDLRELPTLREYSELTAESRKVMTDRLGADPTEMDAETYADEEVRELREGEDSPELDAEAALHAVASVDGSAMAESGIDVESAIDAESMDVSDSEVSDTVPPHSVREGIEYDRWGQPLGPVDDEVEAVSTSAPASADDDDAPFFVDDEAVSESLSEELAAAPDVAPDVALESPESVEAATRESSGSVDSIETASESESIEASASESTDESESLEASTSEPTDESESLEASTSEPTDESESLEASSESTDESEALEASTSQPTDEPVESFESTGESSAESALAEAPVSVDEFADEPSDGDSSELLLGAVESGSDEGLGAVEAESESESESESGSGSDEALGAVAGASFEERANLDLTGTEAASDLEASDHADVPSEPSDDDADLLATGADVADAAAVGDDESTDSGRDGDEPPSE